MQNWYLAKLVFRIASPDGGNTTQFDEQLRVIQAEDELHAFYKARLLGEKEQDHHTKANNKPLYWKFIDVSELHIFNQLIDGAEMFSTIHEESDAVKYMQHTMRKATFILESSICKSVPLN